jgi:7-carboxy-7-deazaguanine synthase
MSDVRIAAQLRGPTLETTGAHAGRACVAIEVGSGGKLAPEDLVRELRRLDTIRTYRAVITGATAASAWTDELAVPVRRAGFRIHLQTDGTQAPAGAVDWLAVTPRRTTRFAELQPDEVRVLVDATSDVHELDDYAARWRCDHYLVQPKTRDDVARCMQLIAARPRWRLCLELRELPALPSAIGTPEQDVQPGAEAETTLLA